MEIFTNIVHFKKTQKNHFVNNSCAPELQTMKFLTQKETKVTQYLLHCCLQIFILERIMLKNKSVYFLAIYANFSCKIEKFE